MTENSRWRILLVDDDEDDYLITREMLAETNACKVMLTWASNYADGLRNITQNGPYDAVLVDYDLGTKTGLDLVREIRPHCCAFPLILLTGRGSYAVDVEAMQAGVSLYLTKNEVNALLLERSIRYAMEMKQNERALLNRAARLQMISDLAADLLRSRDPVDLLDTVSLRMKELVDADVYVHYQAAVDNSHLTLAAIGGYPMDVRDMLQRLAFGQAVCGTVAATCHPMIVQQVQQSRDQLTHLIRHLGITAYACHPLMVHGRLFGTLSFGSRAREVFDQSAIELMRTVCDLIAVAFERRESERIQLEVQAQKFFQRSNEVVE